MMITVYCTVGCLSGGLQKSTLSTPEKWVCLRKITNFVSAC